jgi:hypothetical protein
MRIFFDNMLKRKPSKTQVLLEQIGISLQNNSAAIVSLATALERLQNEICDRLDIIEGQLAEQNKQANPEAASEILKGHKAWTQRRDARVKRHFNVEQLVQRMQSGGKSDA